MFLAWGKAWRLHFSKEEFAVYEQLGFSGKCETNEAKARVQYEDNHSDQTKDRPGGHITRGTPRNGHPAQFHKRSREWPLLFLLPLCC